MDKRTKAWWMISGSLICMLLLFVVKSFTAPKPVCDPDSTAKTVILLDHSETFPTQTSQAIVGRAWEIIEKEMKEGELVSIFNITSKSQKDLKPTFSACKPRKDGNRSIEDVRQLKRAFEEKFKKPLQAELAATVADSDSSPIAQALIDLSLDDVHFRSKELTRLVIFSDFLENTPNFSLYGCNEPGKVIERFRSSRTGSVARPEFHNVDVRMNIIPRHYSSNTNNQLMLRCRDTLWLWFFGDDSGSCGRASCVTPDYLPG